MDFPRRAVFQRLHGNHAEIVANPERNDRMASDLEKGSLYFPWELRRSAEDSRTEAEQIQLARWLRAILEQAGCRVIVAANFENKM